MSEIEVDPIELADERLRLRMVSEQMSDTMTAITAAAGEVLTETAAWRDKWEALDAYDPCAASLNEGMVKIAASLGAITSELGNQEVMSVNRAEETETQEAQNSADIGGIDTDLGGGGGATNSNTAPPATGGGFEA